MQIIFSKDIEYKVDLFLRMVDEDGGGSFGYDEIKEVCILTFEKVKELEGEESDGSDKSDQDDVLDEVAGF